MCFVHLLVCPLPAPGRQSRARSRPRCEPSWWHGVWKTPGASHSCRRALRRDREDRAPADRLADGKIGAPVGGVPPIAAGGQGGLLDVLVDSAFAQNRTVHFCYPARRRWVSQQHRVGPRPLVGRWQPAGEVARIFSQKPKVASRNHFGCRIVERRTARSFSPWAIASSAGRRAEARQPPRQGRAHRQATAACPRTTPSSAAPARCPRYGATATATRRAPRSARDGTLWVHRNTARKAATRSTPRARQELRLAGDHLRRELRRRRPSATESLRRTAWNSRCTIGCPRSRHRAWPSSPVTATAPAGRATCSSVP